MTENEAINKKKITIFDIIAILARQIKIIVVVTIVPSIFLIFYVFITKILPPDSPFNSMPDYFVPITYVNIQQSRNSIISNTSATSAALNALMNSGTSAQNPNIELAKILLNGNTIKDKIIDELDFKSKYKIINKDPNKVRESARLIFSQNISLGGSKNVASTITSISYKDVDSDFAYRVLMNTIEILESRFKELANVQVAIKKAFIEDRMATAEVELKKAQDDIIVFSLKHGVIDISAQAKEQTTVLGNLSSEVIKDEMKLKSLLEYMTEDMPQVVLLKKSIEQKKQAIKDLRNGLSNYSEGVIPQSKIPTLSTEYLNLQGELEIQTRIYAMLREQYELVKIDENDNSQIFQIIEPAEILKAKTGPLRVKTCTIGFAAFFFLSIAVAFIWDYLAALAKLPSEAKKVEEIKKDLHLFKRKKK
jgi:capsule polysaccharide export protein KpsE/RkpR